MSASPLLRVEGMTAGYGDLAIVQDVDLAVPRGSIVSVIGPNGAGKSTLLKALYGIVRPTGGKVVLELDDGAVDISRLRPNARTALGLNYVPQVENVFPNMSVRENLEIGARLQGRARSTAIDGALERFPALRTRGRQHAGTLSGGQRKALAIARALVSEPTLVFLDEPSAGLSPVAVDEVFGLLAELNRDGVSIVMVEQNARRALALSTYAYVLDMGRNRYEGSGTELLRDEKVTELYLGIAATSG